METMIFNNFVLTYPQSMNVYVNKPLKKIIFISSDEDEIHGILEFDEHNKIQIYPRWNVNFTIQGTEITVALITMITKTTNSQGIFERIRGNFNYRVYSFWRSKPIVSN